MNQRSKDAGPNTLANGVLGVLAFFAACVLLGCGSREEWPPAPRNAKEKLILESAMRALRQQDGWTEVACVVKRSGRQWNVQAWQIVHPAARGRKKCVPWLVRDITVNEGGEVVAYRR